MPSLEAPLAFELYLMTDRQTGWTVYGRLLKRLTSDPRVLHPLMIGGYMLSAIRD